MTTDINRCFIRLQDRAERITSEQVADTFVSVGPLMDIFESRNHQIVYGRRGTGKTHALRYLQNSRSQSGDISVYIDGQNLGSNGSIYGDDSLPIQERATRLLVDVCSAVHHELSEAFTDPKKDWDMSIAVPLLDNLIDGFIGSRIMGTVSHESGSSEQTEESSSQSISAKLSAAFSMQGSASSSNKQSDTDTSKRHEEGREASWIDFTFFSRKMREIADFIHPVRLWILIDEWTTVPADIQPYLADLLRRGLFNVPNITLKIAAIEHRSVFKIDRSDESYIGFELGADINAAINLDDYLVFDNNERLARQFFQTFISNHTLATAKDMGLSVPTEETLVRHAFTQDNVFTEFVRATEGVPRDAMHIIASAGQKANDSQISMPLIRSAASLFFQREKYTAIQSNINNRLMLDWIRDVVISGRQTRAFLLPVDIEDDIIDRLFDRRALHILNRSRSAAHRPGERFIVYKLDYGLYVNLANTDIFPDGLLVNSNIADDIDFEVPTDDARSYRRAILEIEDFYKEYPHVRKDIAS